MSDYPQYFLKYPIAAEGDKTITPATSQEAGTGRISQMQGWTSVNSDPIAEGGVPPKREDFNGVLFLLSQFLMWYQKGGVMNYDASLDYEPNNEVFSGGAKYRCLKANGPSSSVVTPGTDKTTWRNCDLPSVLGGQVTAFYNCTVGGSDGRRLIPWGETEAHEDYVLCDGGTDGRGGTVPNLLGKSIEGSSVSDAGGTSGGATFSTSGLPVGAVIPVAGDLGAASDEFVKLNGAKTLSRTEYADAFASLGTTWGEGDGSTTFGLPNLADKWFCGTGSKTMGTNLAAGLPNIRGAFTCYELGKGQIAQGGALFDDSSENYFSLPLREGSQAEQGIAPIIGLNANKYNAIYSDSVNTVQPPSVVLDMCLHVKASQTGTATGTTGQRFKMAYFIKLPD